MFEYISNPFYIFLPKRLTQLFIWVSSFVRFACLPHPPFFLWYILDGKRFRLISINGQWTELKLDQIHWDNVREVEVVYFELTLAMCKFCFALSWEALFPVSHPSDRLLTSAVYLEAPTPESDSSFFSNLSVPLSRSRPLLVLERGRRFLN